MTEKELSFQYAEGYVHRKDYIQPSIYHEMYHRPHKDILCDWSNAILCENCRNEIGGSQCKVCPSCFPNHKHWYMMDGFCDECLLGGDDRE